MSNCVILPLIENSNYEGYLPYIPATLPIFGKYDGYGGIKDIVQNDNTRLIEDHFGITIDKFCSYLINGKFTYGREEVESIFDEAKNSNELEKMRFTWIDRKVYDFMSSFLENGYGGAGDLDMGNKYLLEHIGFEYLGENEKIERYRHEWKFEDKVFHSDGTWLNFDKQGIYRMSDLSKIVNIPKEREYLSKKANWQIWDIFPENEARKLLCSSIGISYPELMTNLFSDDILEKLSEEIKLIYKKSKEGNGTIAHKYINNLSQFGKGLAELRTIRYNLHPMSGQFIPYTLYVTPQCGEYIHHQKLLEEFTKINKSYIEYFE